MYLKPIHKKADYERMLYELMALEAKGYLNQDEYNYIEIVVQLMDGFKARQSVKRKR